MVTLEEYIQEARLAGLTGKDADVAVAAKLRSDGYRVVKLEEPGLRVKLEEPWEPRYVITAELT